MPRPRKPKTAPPAAPASPAESPARNALRLHAQGDFAAAVRMQVQVVNDLAAAGKDNAQAMKLLAAFMFSLKDYAGAVVILEALVSRLPNDADVRENLGVCLGYAGRHEHAAQVLLAASAQQPGNANIHDALARTLGRLKRGEECRRHGEQSLLLKDRAACAKLAPAPPPSLPLPPFRFDQPACNIIAFSLYGDHPRYTEGALTNARLATHIYPGWTCRFYCDETVPEAVRRSLNEAGAQIRMMGKPAHFYDGLFWRFLVAEDTAVERFLVRDCDSIINIKERVAVDEWLASDKHFHVLRDFYTHTELILAGLWGGVGGILPPLNTMLAHFRPNALAMRTLDQLFLREQVWPRIRASCLIHDRHFKCFHAREFPAYGNLPPDRHIGQNDFAIKTGK